MESKMHGNLEPEESVMLREISNDNLTPKNVLDKLINKKIL